MHLLIPAALVGAAVIHLLPAVGVLGANRLAQFYGTCTSDPTLLLLMRHRAVLFGLIGLLLVCAAFNPACRTPAILIGLASTLSFIALAMPVEFYNKEITRIVFADLLAGVLLLLAAILHWLHSG